MLPEPSALMAFFTPQLSRFRTSFRPSTMMREDEDSTFGPQVNPWKDLAVPTVNTERTSSITVFDAASPEFTSVSKSSLARSTTAVRLVARMSLICMTLMMALQGPMRSMVSNELAIIAVSTLSMLLGMTMVPCTLPFLVSISTSTCPTRAVRCNLRSSSSSPSKPSVWPMMAPMMSLRWTVPFTLISARISYFMALPFPPPPRF